MKKGLLKTRTLPNVSQDKNENGQIISWSGREFNSKVLQKELEWVLNLRWTESIWETKDALREKKGGVTWLYTGQTFDNEKVELLQNGWTHDHCDICSNDIREGDSCAICDC